MTELGLYFSRSANGVSKLHGKVAKRQFPDFNINYKTKNLTNQPLRYYQGVKERTMQLEYYSYNWNVGLKYDF